MTERITSYSVDNELFPHESASEAMDELAGDDLLFVGAEYYSCEFEQIDLAKEFLNASWILEYAEERLYDEIEESAEDAFPVSGEAVIELDEILSAWCKKHITRKCYRVVGKSTRHEVTAEDLEDRGDD